MLESQGIVPDYIVGTSAGAVVGSLYASGHDAFAMQKIAQQLDERSSPTGRWVGAASSR
jgi:NTE family protein